MGGRREWGQQMQVLEPLKAGGLPNRYRTTCKQMPFLQGTTHHPTGLGLPLSCPASSEKSPYSLSSPLVQLKEVQALCCLLLAACNSQDGFHTTKCHLFTLLDQHKKYWMGAWDAARWPPTHQQS